MIKVRVTPYADAIINIIIDRNEWTASPEGFWAFVKSEFNGEQSFSWFHKENFIKFNKESDYTMFLLKVT